MTLTTLESHPRTGGSTSVRAIPSGAERPPRPRFASGRADAYTELALAAVTMAAVAGLGRLFSDWSFLLPALASGLVAHALASACRRAGLGGVSSAGISMAAMVLFLAWVLEPHTTTYGLPGPSTWAAVREELALAWRQFATVVAPTPTTPGFTLAAATGAWLTASLGDTFAFRARVRVEALVPSFTLFLFGAMLGADRHRVLLAATYLAGVLAFALTAGRPRDPNLAWFGTRSDNPVGTGLRVGAVVGLVSVAGAVLIGPHLPGAGAEGLIALRDKDKDPKSSRVTVSPLVDIRGRLVEQSDTEVFTVASPAATYWRLTSLDRFDGSIWSSRGNYQRAKGSLPQGPATTGTETVLRQDFAISALSSIWLPAAFRPDRLVGRVNGLRYDAGTASLLTDQPTSDSLRYTIESSLPRFTADQLGAATPTLPADITENYLAVPATFPVSVTALARRVVGSGSGPYQQARALQDWFRDNFTYSLDVPAGHGNRAIQEFLTRRVGYCEQFAGTYAAMARTLGLPARVAVGFTAGTRGADGLFRVAGRNAHAWPEVYLAGYGWVAFEPTPGRGLPGAEDYTGVAAPEEAPPQAQPDQNGAEAGTGAAPAPGPTTVPAPSAEGPRGQENQVGPADQTDPGRRSALSRALGWLAVFVSILTAATLAAIPALKARRRVRRRAAATTPASQVLAAWHDADEGLAVLGLSRFPTETLTEHARRASVAYQGAQHEMAMATASATRTALAELAADATAATWSPGGVPKQAAERSRAAAETVLGGVKTITTRRQRALINFNPCRRGGGASSFGRRDHRHGLSASRSAGRR